MTRSVLPSGKVIKKVYDENKWLSTATTGYDTDDAATTGYTYDLNGNPATTTDPMGKIWTSNYDARNRLKNVIDPLVADRNSQGHTVDYLYDPAGNKVSEQRANDQMVTYDSYDEMNRLKQMTVHQGPTPDAVSKYSWSPGGKIASMTDPNGNLYKYAYDDLNRLSTTTYPTGGGTETRTYDWSGNLDAFKNRGGNIESFTYDGRNRETYASWSSGNPQPRTLVYDDASRVTKCNTTNTFINFDYNRDGSLSSQEEWGTGNYGDGVHRTISFTYDADGNRKTIQYPDSSFFNYGYTERDQLETIRAGQSGGTAVATYGYDPNGNLLTRALDNSTTSTMDYDAANRVTSITHAIVGKPAFGTFAYGYDAVGNRKWVQRDGATGDVFGYDPSGQTTAVKLNIANPTTTAPGAATIIYDASGNRSALDAYGPVAVNNLNQYILGSTPTPTPSATPTPTPTATPTATPKPQAARPTFAPVAGSYPAGDYPKTITIKTTSSGATMRYTTNGTAPTSSVGTLINGTSGTASVPAGATLKAIAFGSAYTDSGVASGSYSAQAVLTPTLSPNVPGGDNVYPNTSVAVTFTCGTAGAVIHYATNRTPTSSDPSVTSGGSHLFTGLDNAMTTVEAMATKAGCPNSAVGAAGYYSDSELPPTPCAMPTFNPVGAAYPTSDYPKTITVSTATTGSGVRIYYTTNGNDPTRMTSTYITGSSGTVKVSSGQTIKALASNPPGYSDSKVSSSGKYTLQGIVDIPALDKSGYSGCSGAQVTVAMTTTTSGATIKYGTGDTVPSRTSGSTYTVPLKITPTTAGVTVRAMAYKDGMSDSSMATGFYLLFPPSDCGGGGNSSDGSPEENGTATQPVYGANGNLKTGLDGSTYTYDAQNRLLSASNGGVSVSYYYDELNRQVARVVNGVAFYSVYDGWNLVAEYTAGGLSQAWLYGPGGIVKELTQNRYYYQDGSGSTSHLTGSDGTLLESYRYDLQGTPIFSDANGNAITASAYGVRHLFTGQQWDGVLGLYDLRNRFYSPSMGRFLQPDPIGFGGDAANLYRYGGNNPVNRSDRSGLVPPGGFQIPLKSINGEIIVIGTPVDPYEAIAGFDPVNANSPQGMLALLGLGGSGGGAGMGFSIVPRGGFSLGPTLPPLPGIVKHGNLALDTDGSRQSYGDPTHQDFTSAMHDVNGNWVSRYNDDTTVNINGLDPLNADTEGYGVAPSKLSSINGGPLTVGDLEQMIFQNGASYTFPIGDFGPPGLYGEVSIYQGEVMGFSPIPVSPYGPLPSFNGRSTPDVPVTVIYYPGSH